MRPSSAKEPHARPTLWLEKPKLVFVLALVMILAMGAANQMPHYLRAPTPVSITATPRAQVTVTHTAIPPELVNLDQTNGLIIGGVILVLIIVGGTLGVIRRKNLE